MFFRSTSGHETSNVPDAAGTKFNVAKSHEQHVASAAWSEDLPSNTTMPAKLSSPISPNCMFSFLFINIAHLYAKYRPKNKLLADYCDSSTMFICLCETFLHEGILDNEVQIPGFIIVRNDRVSRPGGGVCLYLRKNLNYKICLKYSNSVYDLLIVKITSYIVQEIDRKLTPVNIYIDLSKAFDTLNFDILLYRLHYYGVTDIALKLVKSYMSNRKQYVKYNVNESGFKEIKTGVPQGSILGPLLFSIYINDLSTISNTFKFIMYADDTTIYFNTEDFPKDNLAKHITNGLDKVDVWLKHNKLSLNVEKTKCMTFHTCQKKIELLQLSIDGKPIEHVQYFKFLGILFDENLTWKCHINMVTNKLSKVIGILNRLKHVYPQNALLSIYHPLFTTHLNYGLLLWGTHVNRVSKLQKKTVRIMSNSEYLAHSEPLFKTLKLFKIEALYKLKLMKFYYNLSYNLLPSYFNYYLEVINNAFPCQYELRQIARPLIRPQRTRLVFTELNVLFQLIQLLNYTHIHYPEILEKIKYKTHTYHGFSYNVKEKYLGTYKYECSNLICYKCGRM